MLEIGSLVDGKYKILSVVGRGGMSTVYMAINEKANKTWAIKEVRKDGVVNFAAVRQSLVTEANILKRLKHPHLPSIVDVIEDSQTFLIVMDYIEGRSLSDTLKEYGAQPQELVIQWAKQLCDVLGYLHTRTPPIIYRDMKPSNIMLKPDGNIMVFDFGTAREFKAKQMKDTICLGTVGYAAPEQFGGMGSTDARTDIYCLGATLYHLVTGKNPSEPPYEIRPIRQINPALSSGLERIIMKCTQRNPDDRYQSAEELLYALSHYEKIDEEYRKRQKRRLKTFIAAASCAAVFAIGGLVLQGVATKLGTDTYRETLGDANQTSDYGTKCELYEECINIPGKAGETEPYLELMKTYKEDTVFDVSEAKQIERLVKANRSELLKDPEGYVEICFQLGKLFWYHFDYGDRATRAKSCVPWFHIVVENAPAGFKNLGMAKAYENIGIFYRDYQTSVIEATDAGTYKPLYDNLVELLDGVAADTEENEIVRLELLDTAQSAISAYATKFKNDGVLQSQMLELHDKIAADLKDVEPSDDLLAKKKASIEELLPKTKDAIEAAYNTRKEK